MTTMKNIIFNVSSREYTRLFLVAHSSILVHQILRTDKFRYEVAVKCEETKEQFARFGLVMTIVKITRNNLYYLDMHGPNRCWRQYNEKTGQSITGRLDAWGRVSQLKDQALSDRKEWFGTLIDF